MCVRICSLHSPACFWRVFSLWAGPTLNCPYSKPLWDSTFYSDWGRAKLNVLINLILMIVNHFLLCRSRACFCPRLCSGFVLSDSSFICLFLCPLMFSPEQTSWLCFLIQSSSDSVYFSWDTFPQKKDAPTKCVSLVCSGWWHRGAPVSICHTAPSRACASNSEWLQRETSPFEETEMWYSAVCSTKWIFAGGKSFWSLGICHIPIFLYFYSILWVTEFLIRVHKKWIRSQIIALVCPWDYCVFLSSGCI